jgi:hypothetical protein
VNFEAPVGVPDTFEEHASLMYELLAVAYQADVTASSPSCSRVS